jgi:hypothetical protein
MKAFGAPAKVHALNAAAEARPFPLEGGACEVALNSTLMLQGFVRQVEGTRFALDEARREAEESFAPVGATSRIATRVVSENDRSQPRYAGLPSLRREAPRAPFRARPNKHISKAWLRSRVRRSAPPSPPRRPHPAHPSPASVLRVDVAHRPRLTSTPDLRKKRFPALWRALQFVAS